ncbi:MAG: hypothetical protein P8P30_08140 [Rickettsiales bacterium]|nr:hypothetical protein [Rickettsiales bacterium]
MIVAISFASGALIVALLTVDPKEWGFPLFMGIVFLVIGGLAAFFFTLPLDWTISISVFLGWCLGLYQKWREMKEADIAGGAGRRPHR